MTRAILLLALAFSVLVLAPARAAPMRQVTPTGARISEVAWAGTAASATDEWIELVNPGTERIDLAGWMLESASGTVHVALTGTIEAGGYFLLERSSDSAVADIPADQVYTGGLSNTGGTLRLLTPQGQLWDSANLDGGPWPAGSAGPGYYSMERIDANTPDTDGNWAANDGITRCGHDRAGNPINGTPHARNSVALTSTPTPTDTLGPTVTPTATPTATGLATATVTESPAPTSTDTATPTGMPPPSATATPADTATPTPADSPTATPTGSLTPTASPPPESYPVYLPLVAHNSTPPRALVLIDALHARGYQGSADEAFALASRYYAPLELAGWQVKDDGERAAVFPAGAPPLLPGSRLWAAHSAVAFRQEFGFTPAFEYGVDSDPLVPDLAGAALVFANDGGSLSLARQERLDADSANAGGGAWPAGSAAPGYYSMERIDAGAPGLNLNWASNNGITRNGHDRAGNAINGTPRQPNSVAVAPSGPAGVVIGEVAWAGTPASSSDEWLELYNASGAAVDLTGWTLAAPDGAPQITLEGTIEAHAFFLLERGSDGAVADVPADQIYTGGLSNSGEALFLYSTRSELVDVLVYGNAAVPRPGWAGPALMPYSPSSMFAADGQVLYRKMREPGGSVAEDTDTRADWAQDPDDAQSGRRVRYPGWDLEAFFPPLEITTTAVLTVAVAPDHAFEAVFAELARAETSILIETYTFDNAHLADALAAKAAAGVTVTVLLEGEPVGQVGGIADQERWSCWRLEEAGGECWFMHNDDAHGAHDRYTYQHAKFIVVDGRVVLIGSENLGYRGLPADPKSDGTFGQRGAYVITDAPEVVARAESIFRADCDPAPHRDLLRWNADHPIYGRPPLTFTVSYVSGGTTYTPRAPQPLGVRGRLPFSAVQSPENSLHVQSGLLALVARAGPGDSLLVEQFYEPLHWGPGDSNPDLDPNLRLAAYIAAARRGASVRILLDRYYADPADPVGNFATEAYVNALAQAEGLDLAARTGNPAGLGIHNKMLLARIAGAGYIHVGSLNGSETAAKLNRELALQVQSDSAYAYLAAVFDWDWQAAQPPEPVYLPLVAHNFRAPAQHLLVDEVLYDPLGPDAGREWVEIHNPLPVARDLTGYKLGDAEAPGKWGEAMLAFPAGAQLPPGATLVVALDADAFYTDYGAFPDYEIYGNSIYVPNLIAYTSWATGTLSLANGGDEIVLLGPSDTAEDVVTYGTGNYPGVNPHAVVVAGHSLERWPPGWDTDDCAVDFREQVDPQPRARPPHQALPDRLTDRRRRNSGRELR